MSHSQYKVPLGEVLQQAGLVSAEQVKQALEKQKRTDRGLKIGEILAAQGHIDLKTADFFVQCWPKLSEEKSKQPIYKYFKQAALLNESQIQAILREQRQTRKQFGEVAIAKGWLEPTTVNFFRERFKPGLVQSESPKIEGMREKSNNTISSAYSTTNPEITFKISSQKSTEQSEYSQKVHEGFLKIKRKLLNIDNRDNYSEQTLDRVLLWTGGQSFLTQKLFELLAKNNHTLKPGLEIEQIDLLVQSKLLHNWEDNELGMHLKTIKDRLLDNQQCDSRHLLQLYQQILTETVSLDHSQEQQELLNMGLVLRQHDKLMVANRIYQSVFNLGWVTTMLTPTTPASSSGNTNTSQTKSSRKMTATSKSEKHASLFKFKNILIFLGFVGLLTIFINTIAKRMTVRVAFRQANELLKQKSFAEAVERYNQLLNIDSNYYQAWTNRGYALAGLQQYEEMRESCAAATVIEPTAVYAWNCQGEALHNLQRGSEAIAAFNQAIALDRTNPIFLINKSESLKKLGKDDESLTVIEEAIQVLEKRQTIQGRESVSREFAVALAFLGNGYRKKEQYQDALEAYERAIVYSPNYFPALIGKGITLGRAGRYREARNVFKNILEDPQLSKARQAQTWFYLGKTLCESQQKSLGIDALERSLNLEPSYQIAEEAQKQCT